MSETKVILVTGTSSGFGRLTAETLARKGHKVFATMRNSETRNAEARRALQDLAQKENLDLHVLELDVADENSVETAVRKVMQEAGHIDVLVNNAGVVSYGPLEAFKLDQVRKLFDVNLFGAMHMNQAVLPYMRERGSGLLVHVSSGLGRLVFPVMGVYCASKFALEAIAETYRYELAEIGIDSVVVEPGVYPTSINISAGQAADADINAAYGPLGDLSAQLPRQFRDGYQDRDSGEVANAIIDLIEMVPGTRPLRTCVGAEAEAAKPLNQTASQIQGGLFEAFGMPHLAKFSA